MSNPGRNNGITGLVDLPNLEGLAGVAPLFTFQALGFDRGLSIGSKERRGRGTTGKFAGRRPLTAGGGLTITGRMTLGTWPAPDKWAGQRGTVLITYDDEPGKSETCDVVVESFTIGRKEKDGSATTYTLTCSIVGQPVLAGFGDADHPQPAATDQAPSDQEQWAGTSKTYDGDNILRAATQAIDVWGSLANTDAAELARLAGIVAAAVTPPQPYLKVRTATFNRDSDDGGVVVINWAMTTAAEDMVNEASHTTADTFGHAGGATTAAVNATPPAAAGLVLRTTDAKEVNDQVTLNTAVYGERTTRDDVVFPRTKYATDVSALEQETMLCTVFTTGTPPADPTPLPSGMVIADYFDVPDSNAAASNQSIRVYRLAFVSNAQRETLGRYELATDPNALDTVKRSAVIWDSAGAAPANPTPPVGLKLSAITDVAVPSHPTKQVRVYRFEPNDSIDRRTNPRTRTETDTQAIERDDTTAVVFTVGSPPVDPAPPAGMKLAGYFDVPETPTRSVRVYRFSYTHSKDRLELDRYRATADPNALESETLSGAVWDSAGAAPADPAAPAGLKLYSKSDVGIASHPTKRVRVYRWTPRDSVDDRTFPRTRTQTDAQAISQTNFVAQVIDDASPPAAPTPPTGMKVVDHVDVPDVPGKSVRVYSIAYVDGKDRLELAHYRFNTDPNGLDSFKVSAAVWDSAGAAPTPPTPPAGLKVDAYTDVSVESHPTKQVRIYRWAKTDSVDRLVLPHTWTDADPSNVDSQGEVAALNATPTVPTGYKSRGTRGIYQNGIDLLNVTKFGLRSTIDDVNMPVTTGAGDWLEGNRRVDSSVVTTAFSAATQAQNVIAANLGDKTFNRVWVKQLNDNLSQVVIERQDETVTVEFEMRYVGHVYTPARLSGTDVYVYVGSFRQIGVDAGGTAVYEGQILPQRYLGVRMNFSVIRRTTGASVPLNLGFAGTSNSAAFLGLPTSTVVYTGAGGRARIDNTGAAIGVSFMSYHFFYDSLGHFDLGDVREGYFQVKGAYGAYTSTRGAWRKATDLGFTPALLNTGNFTGAYT